MRHARPLPLENNAIVPEMKEALAANCKGFDTSMERTTGVSTRDSNLGKVVLYQLSHVRAQVKALYGNQFFSNPFEKTSGLYL